MTGKSSGEMARLLWVMLASVSIVSASSTPSWAQAASLLQPFGPSLLLQDGATGQPLGVAGSTNTAPSPAWLGAQWGIEDNVQPAMGSPDGWSNANQYARFRFYKQNNGVQNVYELAQNATACNHERDLFLGAKRSSEQPAGGSAGFQPTDPLTQIGSLPFSVNLNVTYSSDKGTCASKGAPHYSGYAFSFILSSTTSQTLFYQIDLGQAPYGFNQNTSVRWCPGYDTSNDGAFCLDDDVRNLGGPFLAGNQSATYLLDFLPRVLQVITAGHAKTGVPVTLDANPADWTVTSIYIGEITQGDIVDATQWSNPSVVSYPGGTFCNGSHSTIQFVCNAGQPPLGGWVNQNNGCFQKNTGKSC